MTKEEIGGVVRALASAAFGFLAARGYVDAETAVTLAGALGTLAVAVWSLRAKKVG